MSKILIKNGRLIDPADKIDAVTDILVEGGKIAKIAQGIKDKADETIDAKGKIVMPGIVDMHVHLREPGREDKETVASGTKAAAAGGVTSLLAMPNTQPAIDSAESVNLLKGILKKSALVNVFICAAITKGRNGQELTDIKGLKKLGAVAISDDGSSVEDEALMLEALKAAKETGLLVVGHCEDKKLSAGGVVNLGLISTKLGLRGISKESEYKRVEREVLLAKKIDASVHIAHVSCKESVEIIARAKTQGVKITAEATPHHFTLSDEALSAYDPNLKMNPPLRSKDDLAAIKAGLKSGAIDAIASDHAPHTENEKEIEFDRAEFGVIGVQTMLAVGISELVKTKVLDWPEFVAKLTINPARILNIAKGSLSVGGDADIVIVDPEQEFIVSKEKLFSRSRNSAFLGRRLQGVVEYTLCSGQVVYKGV